MLHARNCSPKASLGGRVKDVNARKMLAKQMGDLSSEFASMDMKTGQIKQRKPKKEVSAEQTAMKDLKTLEKRKLGLKSGKLSRFSSFEVYHIVLHLCQGERPDQCCACELARL